MSGASIVVVVAAVFAAGGMGCEHRRQPAPEPVRAPEPAAEPAPEPAAAPAPAPAPAPDTGAGSGIPGTGAGSGDSELARANAAQFKACTEVATHTVELMIASAPATNRPQLEAQRAQMISGMREPCVMKAWSAEALACLGAATDQRAIEACRSLLPH